MNFLLSIISSILLVISTTNAVYVQNQSFNNNFVTATIAPPAPTCYNNNICPNQGLSCCRANNARTGQGRCLNRNSFLAINLRCAQNN